MSVKARKRMAQLAAHFGYTIERRLWLGDAVLDVFDLAVKLRMASGRQFRFLQVGANDGVTDDPIRPYIVSCRWSGVLLEPQPGPFARLSENCKELPGLELVNAALAESDGSITLYTAEGSEYLGGIDARSVERHRGKKAIKEIQVPAIAARTLVDRYSLTDVDLLQVDAEGFDCRAIKLLLAAGMTPAMIRFEHYHISRPELEECIGMLGQRGYKVARIGVDLLAVQ